MGRAAGHDVDALQTGQILPGQLDVVQNHLPILNPGPNGIPERPRLLMNLLQHKMGVAAPLCVGEFPSNLFRFFLHRLAVDIIKRSAVCCKCHHVAVVQIGHLAGVF